MCDQVKLTFNLKYDYNVTEMLDTNKIKCYISNDEIYNKVKLKMKIIPFGKFTPDFTNVNILPFVIDTPIIDNLKNKIVFQELNNLDILCFNDGIYFSNNIIRYFLLWMKYESPKDDFFNSQRFHGDDDNKIISKMEMIKIFFLITI